jgi:hypothetical protein
MTTSHIGDITSRVSASKGKGNAIASCSGAPAGRWGVGRLPPGLSEAARRCQRRDPQVFGPPGKPGNRQTQRLAGGNALGELGVRSKSAVKLL